MEQNETKIEQLNEPIPFIAHESDMARSDLKNKRLWLTLNFVIAALVILGVITCLDKH